MGDHKYLEGSVKPEGFSVEGQKIQFFSVKTEELKNAGAKFALSIFNAAGEPVIFYDEASLAQYPPEFQNWIFAHEVAHFEMGHYNPQQVVFQKSMGYEGVQSNHELDADYNAVLTLIYNFHYTDEQIRRVAEIVSEVFGHQSGNSFYGGYAHQFKHPSGQDRGKNILNCLDEIRGRSTHSTRRPSP